MRLIELRGPEAAETHAAWALRLRRLKGRLRRTARAIRRAVQPLMKRHPRVPQPLEFYAEAGAPEGALYPQGRLSASPPGGIKPVRLRR